MRIPFAAIAILLAFTIARLGGFERRGNNYLTDGSFGDVESAAGHASKGDQVRIPAGHFVWGANHGTLNLTKEITVVGAGEGNTVIDLAPDISRPQNGIIRLAGPATIGELTLNGAPHVAAFSVANVSGWRITRVDYEAGASAAYFAIVNGSYGLIDHCRIVGGAGNNELIFTRGPVNSWDTADSLGGPENLFVEECTFGGRGYVCDANANSRMVVRFCTIETLMKVDAHGIASNVPRRSCREIEVYDNTWTTVQHYGPAIEIRGGTGVIFGNRLPNQVPRVAWFFLMDYATIAPWRNFGKKFQTPADYPIEGQIGRGRKGAEPMYVWDNLAAAQAGAGVATVPWMPVGKKIPPAAIEYYRQQIHDPAATYTMQDIVKADRDYFLETPGVPFDGSSGVGIGTRAQMMAIGSARAGVGFWVTDEGDWNHRQAGPSGRLYVWDGSAWKLRYEPYRFPHPLSTDIPR
ncbi:MAG TPA: hypothetical protein VGL42_06435 [Opitutaceae bacterium]|jgi:hypothetical protein